MRAPVWHGLAWLACTLLVACTAPATMPSRTVPTMTPAPIASATTLPTVVASPRALAPTTTLVPIAAATVVASPRALAPTTTLAPTATPTVPPPGVASPLATAAPLPTTSPPPTAACREPQGQLSVAYLDSAVLARRVAYSIYLPPCYDTDATPLYPTLYLLHGANADHTQWPDLNVALDADRLIAQQAIAPLVVVMPDGDYQPGEDYAAFVLRDLLPHIEQTTRVARDGRQRAIGGLSRGGWWALLIALAHPDLFSAVGGHSPVTDAALTQQLALLGADAAPRIYLDVGRDDSLASGVTAFASALEAQGLRPVVHLYPGAHNRPYWRAHTAEYLRFYALSWAAR